MKHHIRLALLVAWAVLVACILTGLLKEEVPVPFFSWDTPPPSVFAHVQQRTFGITRCTAAAPRFDRPYDYWPEPTVYGGQHNGVRVIWMLGVGFQSRPGSYWSLVMPLWYVLVLCLTPAFVLAFFRIRAWQKHRKLKKLGHDPRGFEVTPVTS
jgi:hypothetical protein